MSARVLVIEDNGPNLELMTYLLKAFGHAPESARDGEEGLAAATRGDFDIIICDIQLPKRDGFEVAAAIRQTSQRRTPLLAVTAFAQVGDRERVLAGGFDGYISKPIVPETFVSQVESFLPVELRSPGALPPETALQPDVRPLSPPKSATILVVDNVEPNRQLMCSLLEPFGYEVQVAKGVQEALRFLSARVPDLIVCDLHLEDGSGYDLIRSVREDSRLSSVPFIFLSATGRAAEDGARGLALGARKFIVRPIDPPLLLKEIEECLRTA